MQLIFALVVTIIVWGLPESPRWLANRGHEEEAIEVLCAVFDRERDDPLIVEQIQGIRHAIAVETAAGTAKIANLFKNDRLKTRKRVFLAAFVLFINQLSGINMVTTCGPNTKRILQGLFVHVSLTVLSADDILHAHATR